MGKIGVSRETRCFPAGRSDVISHLFNESKLIIGLSLFLFLDAGHDLRDRYCQCVVPDWAAFFVRGCFPAFNPAMVLQGFDRNADLRLAQVGTTFNFPGGCFRHIRKEYQNLGNGSLCANLDEEVDEFFFLLGE